MSPSINSPHVSVYGCTIISVQKLFEVVSFD